MKRALGVVALALAVGGCDKGPVDDTPTVRGADAGLVAQVDCGDDGVANVNVAYGQINENRLIGRNTITQTFGKGSASYDNRFGIIKGQTRTDFTITTDPTTGTCSTTLTNSESGDVLAERKSAGKVVLKAALLD